MVQVGNVLTNCYFAWNTQGSVLWPILFVIFVNDLPEETNSIAQMFADDTKLYRTIKDQGDQKQLQKDIDALAT